MAPCAATPWYKQFPNPEVLRVKLKMAPNSLFAVLLRSPWWISFLVVLAFVLASRALLPEQFMVFGFMGALPFLVIGSIAAFRQFRAPSAQQVEHTLQNVAAMSWREFAGALEQAYARQGYAVSRADGPAADLLLAKEGQRTLVAGKRWKAGVHGIEPLRALSEARQAQDTSRCLYITLADVGDKTRRFATQNRVDLLHGAALAQLLRGTAAAKK